MGTWGIGSFQDDIAVDWLEDLYDSEPLAFFRQCLDLSGEQYVGYIACIGVVCTAEMIHGCLREPRPGMPEAAHQWLQQNQQLHVLPFVGEAIVDLGRVLGPQSEMYELWEDDGDRMEDWRASVRDLMLRLEKVAAEIQ